MSLLLLMTWPIWVLAAAGLFLVAVTIGPLFAASNHDDAFGRDDKPGIDEESKS